MDRPEAGTLLHAWERGAAQGTAMRGLLLLCAARPQDQPDALAGLSIGRRDAALLELREHMFGPQFDCLSNCAHCGEQIELAFPVAGIRAQCIESGARLQVTAGGRELQFRLPHTGDLLALAGIQDVQLAERELLRRCVLDGDAESLLPEEIAAIDRRMSEADPQAEVQLDITCPECAGAARATFDIVRHLWAELEAWARALLREIHALASAYGWSEAQILALSAARRRAYLEFIAAR